MCKGKIGLPPSWRSPVSNGNLGANLDHAIGWDLKVGRRVLPQFGPQTDSSRSGLPSQQVLHDNSNRHGDRYQSAVDQHGDVELCLEKLRNHGDSSQG